MNPLARISTRVIDRLYVWPFDSVMPLQTFRYAVCGALNMGLDLVLYYLSFHYIFRAENLDLGFVVVSPYIAALGLVFPITFFNGFWLNRHIAFKKSPLHGRTQLGRYALSVLGAIVLNYACMKLFVEGFGIFPIPSKALTTLVSVCYSYMMQKYFTFRGCAEI